MTARTLSNTSKQKEKEEAEQPTLSSISEKKKMKINSNERRQMNTTTIPRTLTETNWITSIHKENNNTTLSSN